MSPPPGTARALGAAVACTLLAGWWSPLAQDGPPDLPEDLQEPATAPDERDVRPPALGWKVGKGVFFRKRGADRFRFVAWEGEDSVNRVFSALRLWRGGEVHFAPGTYTLEQGFRVSRTPDVTISGSPGVVLEFAPGVEDPPRTLEPVEDGATSIRVDRPETLRPGWRYQLYSPRRSGARVLEFQIESVVGNEVLLARPVRYMPMITEIPVGCQVLEEINFFRTRECPNMVIRGLVMDGKGRGPVRGHTLYCGVYATGIYKDGVRPRTFGLTVSGCTFRGLAGRGVCAYGMGDVRVESCGFYDIGAQAVEIDHFSSGVVLNNHVDGAESGVMLNDAFESIVEGNVLQRCEIGVRLLRIFPEDWVNTGNIVRENLIGPGCELGIRLEDNLADGLRGNVIRGNHFVGLEPEERIVGGEGNDVKGNTREP